MSLPPIAFTVFVPSNAAMISESFDKVDVSFPVVSKTIFALMKPVLVTVASTSPIDSSATPLRVV